MIRQIFTASSGEEARLRLSKATSQLERRLPKIAMMIEEAEEDILAFYEFPRERWTEAQTHEPLKRFNRETGRHTDVVRSSQTTSRTQNSYTTSPD